MIADKDRIDGILETYDVIIDADADGQRLFDARDGGRCAGCKLVNGAVACDGSNGYKIQVLNRSDSDNALGYFGYGSGTEAAKASDKDVAVAAYEVAELTNTGNVASTDVCSKGDNIEIAIDRDGTTVRGTVIVTMEYGLLGRS